MIYAEHTDLQDTFVKGVGIRFAAANWIMAAWAVCWVRTRSLLANPRLCSGSTALACCCSSTLSLCKYNHRHD